MQCFTCACVSALYLNRLQHADIPESAPMAALLALAVYCLQASQGRQNLSAPKTERELARADYERKLLEEAARSKAVSAAAPLVEGDTRCAWLQPVGEAAMDPGYLLGNYLTAGQLADRWPSPVAAGRQPLQDPSPKKDYMLSLAWAALLYPRSREESKQARAEIERLLEESRREVAKMHQRWDEARRRQANRKPSGSSSTQ